MITCTRLLLLASVSVALAAGCAKNATPATQPAEVAITALDPLPVPARLAALRETPNATIKSVASSEFLGREVYTVHFTTADKKKGELQVTSDGRTIYKSIEEETIPFAKVPEAVRVAAVTQTGGVVPKSVRRRSIADREAFTLDVRIADTQHQLTFDSAGSLLRQESEITATQAPVRVSAAMAQRFPGFKLKSVSEVRERSLLYYVYEGGANKRDIEAAVLPDGTFRYVRTK